MPLLAHDSDHSRGAEPRELNYCRRGVKCHGTSSLALRCLMPAAARHSPLLPSRKQNFGLVVTLDARHTPAASVSFAQVVGQTDPPMTSLVQVEGSSTVAKDHKLQAPADDVVPEKQDTTHASQDADAADAVTKAPLAEEELDMSEAEMAMVKLLAKVLCMSDIQLRIFVHATVTTATQHYHRLLIYQ